MREKRSGINAAGRYLFRGRRHKKLKPPAEGKFTIAIPKEEVDQEIKKMPTGITVNLKNTLEQIKTVSRSTLLYRLSPSINTSWQYSEQYEYPIPFNLPDVAKPYEQFRIDAVGYYDLPSQVMEGRRQKLLTEGPHEGETTHE